MYQLLSLPSQLFCFLRPRLIQYEVEVSCHSMDVSIGKKYSVVPISSTICSDTVCRCARPKSRRCSKSHWSLKILPPTGTTGTLLPVPVYLTHRWGVFDPFMGPCQVLPPWVKVDLGAVAVKGSLHTPKNSGSPEPEPCYRMQFKVIPRTPLSLPAAHPRSH